MYDSFYHHKTRQNLNLLKSTLISKNMKILDSKPSIFRSTNIPFETNHQCNFSQTSVKNSKEIKISRANFSLNPHEKTNKLSILDSIQVISKNNSDKNEAYYAKKHIEKMPLLASTQSLSTQTPINKKVAQKDKTHIRKNSLFEHKILIQTPQINFNNLPLQNKMIFTSSFFTENSQKNSHKIAMKPSQKLPKIKAKSWLIFDVKSSKMLLSKKPRKTREIASLTKIMTCYLVCLYIEKFQMNPSIYYMKVPKSATIIGGTSACLEPGDSLSIIDLLYGMMLPSGNDAAYCLGKFFGKLAYILYQEEKNKPFGVKKQKFAEIYKEKWDFELNSKDFVRCFVCEMNKTARNEELSNTYFNNPHGLCDKINKSTAEDIAKLSILALKSKLFFEIVNKKEYCCEVRAKKNENKQMYWKNTNELLEKGFNGIKTGNTPSAGPCFATGFQQQGLDVIIVILKTKSHDSRFGDAMKLLKWMLKTSRNNEENDLF